jgi:hypothetical protein
LGGGGRGGQGGGGWAGGGGTLRQKARWMARLMVEPEAV